MASVLHLFRASQRRLPMEEALEVRALEDSGLEGCAHARTGSPRQVLLMDSETLELMELSPGIIRGTWASCAGSERPGADSCLPHPSWRARQAHRAEQSNRIHAVLPFWPG